jgi:hypothetical protein
MTSADELPAARDPARWSIDAQEPVPVDRSRISRRTS